MYQEQYDSGVECARQLAESSGKLRQVKASRDQLSVQLSETSARLSEAQQSHADIHQSHTQEREQLEAEVCLRPVLFVFSFEQIC